MESMAVGKTFKDNTAKINSLDFSKEGDFLITASDDESLHIYNTVSGKKHKSIFSKKYGVDLIRFTHHSSSVICASKNSWDESLRYLSLHDNRYLRYFKGHRDKVVSLALSPTSDFFISGSLDNTIRLWDLNSNSCQVRSLLLSLTYRDSYVEKVAQQYHLILKGSSLLLQHLPT